MNILIIGAGGFIGMHCARYFIAKGYSVVGADISAINNTAVFYTLNRANTDFNVVFKDNSFDVCINASGAASVPLSLEIPLLDFSLNTGNVIKILEAIRIHNPSCYFINFSSAAVYGNPHSLPITEDMQPAPMSPYGWHKYFAEQICREYTEYFNIKTCNLRVFSAYGSGLQKQFFWDLFNKLKTGEEVSLFGTGNESRDFIHAEDISRCVDLVIKNRDHMPPVINIASGIEITIKEAAQSFAKLLGHKGTINFRGEIRLGDPINWRADIGVLKSIGFSPLFTFEQGIEEYIVWLRKEKK